MMYVRQCAEGLVVKPVGGTSPSATSPKQGTGKMSTNIIWLAIAYVLGILTTGIFLHVFCPSRQPESPKTTTATDDELSPITFLENAGIFMVSAIIVSLFVFATYNKWPWEYANTFQKNYSSQYTKHVPNTGDKQAWDTVMTGPLPVQENSEGKCVFPSDFVTYLHNHEIVGHRGPTPAERKKYCPTESSPHKTSK